MKNKGINGVSALYGGLDSWPALGYPMATGAAQ
jgi:rhodanese-related sulfurtransferase